MDNNLSKKKQTNFETLSTFIAVGFIMLLLYSIFFRAPQPNDPKFIQETRKLLNLSTITESEIPTLVGLTAPELIKTLGKPFSVSSSALHQGGEVWYWTNKVRHESTGLTRSLFCEIKDGKCVKANPH